jgi:hypothetical protein
VLGNPVSSTRPHVRSLIADLYTVVASRFQRSAAVASATALVVFVLALTTPTPHDPDASGTCGIMLHEGLSLDFACEQTRGAYRGIILVAPLMFLIFLVLVFARPGWLRWPIALAAWLLAGISAIFTAALLFGSHLVDRWVAVFPAALALTALGVRPSGLPRRRKEAAGAADLSGGAPLDPDCVGSPAH